MMRPRLLPTLAGAAALLFCAKLADIWLAIDAGPVATARAEAAPAKPEAAKHDPAKSEAADPAKSEGAGKPEAAKAAAEGEAGDKAGQSDAPKRLAVRDPREFSPHEVQLLQSLSQRRAELDKRAADMEQREALLQAAEKRINDKIAKLAVMQKEIDASFKKQDQLDDSKLLSLVKVYESMKPKDAARIFDQLDMPVLVDVAERMKALKISAVLAGMDATKAKALTLALAARHPSPELKN